MHQHFVDDPDIEYLIIESITGRAHPCAPGCSQKRGGQAFQALGRSRGEFSTKIHVSVDALGNPLQFQLTEGERHYITESDAIVAGFNAQHVVGDQGYDATEFIELIHNVSATPVIPPRLNLRTSWEYHKHLYRERHLVECLINMTKHYRYIFPRFAISSHCLPGVPLVEKAHTLLDPISYECRM